MKSFDVPSHYRSALLTAIKEERKASDRLKRDFAPTILRVGTLEIILARHFGFCYGVENAIEIAFRAVAENPEKRIYLLSEMIHNAGVNADLRSKGVQFIMDTSGGMLMDWNELTEDDVVIVPAFGTTLEVEQKLRDKGIEPAQYETTCPFVEKVWNRAEKIGRDHYTIVVHGKPGHEETRATFSHSMAITPTVVVKDMDEAARLAQYICKELPPERFYKDFEGQYSPGFSPLKDLERIGVVNQTTMLAIETQAIADYLKNVMVEHYHLMPADVGTRFSDTRDTLCYATNDNQSAVHAMLAHEADFAIVIGGYNSSNTSHLVALCEEKLPTFFISGDDCLSGDQIRHFDFASHKELNASWPISLTSPMSVMVTSGASCPDALVEAVINRLAALTGNGTARHGLKWAPKDIT